MQTNLQPIDISPTSTSPTSTSPATCCFSHSRVTQSRVHRVLSLPILSLPLAFGLSCQVAFAQGTAAAPSSLLSDLVSLLTTVALGCLVFGLFKPLAFQKLFKEKTSRGRVAATFGGALFLLFLVDKAVTPRPPQSEVARAGNNSAVNDSATNKASSSNDARMSERVRLAEERAKAAEDRVKEARTVKAERAAKAKPDTPAKSSSASERGPQAAPPAGEEVSPNVSVQTIEGLGQREVGIVDDVAYLIQEIETASSIGNEFSRTQADGVFHVVRVLAYNNDKETHDLNTSLMKLLDDQGREFDPSSKGGTALVMSGDQSAELFLTQIQPGMKKQFSLVYDLPEGASGLRLKVPGGFFSRSGDATIKAP